MREGTEWNREAESARSKAQARMIENERNPHWTQIAAELRKGPKPTDGDLKDWMWLLQSRDRG